jgi:hypothetical protein
MLAKTLVIKTQATKPTVKSNTVLLQRSRNARFNHPTATAAKGATKLYQAATLQNDCCDLGVVSMWPICLDLQELTYVDIEAKTLSSSAPSLVSEPRLRARMKAVNTKVAQIAV